MAIWLPALATDRIARRDRARRDAERRSTGPDTRPLMVVASERQRQVVTACCARAARAGVRPGMPVAQARALFADPDVRIEPADPAGDAGTLRRLAVWAQRLSPVAAVDAPDGLLIDITGCGPVWHGEERLVRAALDGLGGLGFMARAAVAPTFGCAWAVSRFAEPRACIIGPGGVRTAMTALPTAALRLDQTVVTALAQLGIERVGHVLDLPRAALPARFGPELLWRVDQALGQALETIEPVRPVPPPAVERVFDGPTKRTDAIERTVRELLELLADELQHRGCGARRVDVTLTRSDLGPEVLCVTLGRPSRGARHLWQLLSPKLERAHLGFGVEAVSVRAPVVGVVRHEQGGLDGPWTDGEGGAMGRGVGRISPAEAQRAAAELLDTLRNRLGRRRVLQAELRASHRPERSFVLREAADDAGHAVVASAVDTAVAPPALDRPTVLFDPPCPAEVIALTPDGPVHRLTWQGREHEITACVGPERIGSEWWHGPPGRAERTRDYFAVRDAAGLWLWVGRGLESGRWFVHGVWA